MEEGHHLAAHALLQQLASSAPAVAAPPTNQPGTNQPATNQRPPEPRPAIPIESVVPPEPRPVEPEEATERCRVCQAVMSPAMPWCQLCLTPRLSEPIAAHRSAYGEMAFPAAAPPPVATEERPGVARSAIWLAVVVIVFNIVVQATTYALERSAQVQPDTAIAIGLWVGLAFYVVVAGFALRTRAAAFVRTAWTVGDPRVALQKGLLIGGLTSVVVLGLQSLATHHLVGDPTVQLVVSDRAIWRVVAAFLLFVGVGPLVEEYIFRGILAESLKGRGTKAATITSALLFALAHLRPAALIYYTVIGCILGRLYFRYGMKASVAAHAIFNGLLVVAALISVLGPAQTFTYDGASLHLPAAWKSVQPPAGASSQFVAQGPSASAIVVLDRSVPAGATFDPAAVASAVQNHEFPIPASYTVSSAGTVDYPAGRAAVLTIVAEGHPGKVVVMMEHQREWLLVLSSAGSSKAVSDFNQMLEKLTLP